MPCRDAGSTLSALLRGSLDCQDEEARPKAPPNDPQRQGNIWHRYEQLEGMTKSLATVNQQMVLEKTKHQRVGLPFSQLPHVLATMRSSMTQRSTSC